MALMLAVGMSSLLHKKKAVSFVSTTVLLAIVMVSSIYYQYSGSNFTVFGIYHIYAFSSFMVMLFAFSMALVNAVYYSAENQNAYLRFSFVASLIAIGAFSIAMAGSLLTILISVEIVTSPTILLIALNGKKYAEPAAKLFIMAAISIAVLAFAIALMFPYDSTLSLSALASSGSFSTDYITLVALALFVAALGTEAALFPFDMWIPDVYQGSPSSISALIAGINKKVAFVALIEILFVVFAAYLSTISLVLSALAIMTMFFGNLGALMQTNVKRMFAYSSISQAGYITVGLAAATSYGIESSIFQIFAHSLMIIGAFAIVGFFEVYGLKSISDYAGLYKRNWFATLALTIIMLSMAGIPPLLGFMGKFLLFSSAISSGLLALAFIGILNSFISIYYYSKLISSMYSYGGHQKVQIPAMLYAVIIIIIAAIILFGIYPVPLIAAASHAAASLKAI